MKAADALTLEACLIALAKLETELPPELHQAVAANRACPPGQRFSGGYPTPGSGHAARRATGSTTKWLAWLYKSKYRTQERAKSGRPDANGSAGTATLTLQDFASPILSSEDFRSATSTTL